MIGQEETKGKSMNVTDRVLHDKKKYENISGLIIKLHFHKMSRNC